MACSFLAWLMQSCLLSPPNAATFVLSVSPVLSTEGSALNHSCDQWRLKVENLWLVSFISDCRVHVMSTEKMINTASNNSWKCCVTLLWKGWIWSFYFSNCNNINWVNWVFKWRTPPPLVFSYTPEQFFLIRGLGLWLGLPWRRRMQSEVRALHPFLSSRGVSFGCGTGTGLQIWGTQAEHP